MMNDQKYLLKILQISCTELPSIDMKGKNDTYIKFTFGELFSGKTEVIWDSGSHAEWNVTGFLTNPISQSDISISTTSSIQSEFIPCGILGDLAVQVDSNYFDDNLLSVKLLDYNSLRPHTLIGECNIKLSLEDIPIGEPKEYSFNFNNSSGGIVGPCKLCIFVDVSSEENTYGTSNSYLGKSRYYKNKSLEVAKIKDIVPLMNRDSMKYKNLMDKFKNHNNKNTISLKSCKLMDRFELCDREGQFELDISDLSLEDWPDQASMFPNIRRLLANKNNIKIIPNLSYFIGIEYINLSNNRIKDLNDVKFSLIRTLKVLDVSRNFIEYLPDDIINLPILENLQVHRNKLAEFPSGMSNLYSLKIINAEYNNLRSIPADFESIPKLHNLNLSHNSELSEENIPAKIYELHEIRNLMISKDTRRVLIQRTLGLTKKIIQNEHKIRLQGNFNLKKKQF